MPLFAWLSNVTMVHVYIMSVYGCFGLPPVNSLSDFTIFTIVFCFCKGQKKGLTIQTPSKKGCYISNTCFKQLTNHNRWGQLTNQSKLGFSESMPLKRQVLKQSISGRGWKGVQGSKNPMSQGYCIFQLGYQSVQYHRPATTGLLGFPRVLKSFLI